VEAGGPIVTGDRVWIDDAGAGTDIREDPEPR
jgi:hypothetical protein